MVRIRAVALVATALAAGSVGASSCARPAPEAGVTVTVLAAASLQDSFTALAERFEADRPGTDIRLVLGPSNGLASQVLQGAPADVLATASAATMERVTAEGLVLAPVTFAVNVVAIATPLDPTTPVERLGDLADPGVKVAVCAPEVPCGIAADALFARASLVVTPVTREVDVKAVLAKVVLGEVDAGVVYATDLRAAGDSVAGFAVPAADEVSTAYSIATLTTAGDRAAAEAFVDVVLSPLGQEVLADAGFRAP